MEKQETGRTQAIDALVRNVEVQNFIPEDGDPAYVTPNGEKVYMPAYVPYVGPRYFEYRPRILCFAMNQNLSKHRAWSEIWMHEWATDRKCAIDRLNHAVGCGRALPVKPYAEGFIPLAALLYLLAKVDAERNGLPDTIDEVISVTNFVKFSKSDSASSSDIPDSWWRESASRCVCHEIAVLKPDVILTFGGRTRMEVERVLSCMSVEGGRLQVEACRFPGRIPSLKARPARGNERVYWTQHVLPLVSRIGLPVESFVNRRMTRFPGYFLDIAKGWGLL